MGRQGRIIGALIVGGALALTAIGAGVAVAQSGGETTAADRTPEALLDRLAELEPDLPNNPPPLEPTVDAETTWGALEGDATSVRVVLDLLEPDLRRLFIDADDTDGDVARGVALVARGWLDVWTGTTSIALAESADLAFPLDTTDAQGVATGADDLRGHLEIGLDLLVQGRARHLEGYGLLRDLGEAPLDAQLRFDDRARAAEVYDAEVRPVLATMLSRQSVSVLVTTERFVTDAPGVRSRAASMTVVCVDREALEALGGVATNEVLAQLEDAGRVDCAALPGGEEQ